MDNQLIWAIVIKTSFSIVADYAKQLLNIVNVITKNYALMTIGSLYTSVEYVSLFCTNIQCQQNPNEVLIFE